VIARRAFSPALRASRVLAATLVLGAAALVAACSSASDGGAAVPCRPNGGTEAYPLSDNTCGTESGEVLANYSFTGRLAGPTSAQQSIKMSDYYDPDGKKGLSLMVINVSAFWCQFCKEEAPQLATLDAQYKAKGVVWLTVVEQDANRAPATDANVDAWISAYKLVTPAVSDPQQTLSGFFNPDLMPLNMIVDLKTMKIVKKITGSGLPQVQAELAARVGT
jgi:thiol-disulfide isomerase/thioredoxin